MQSSEGSREVPGWVLGPLGATWGGPRKASNHYFLEVNTLQKQILWSLGDFKRLVGESGFVFPFFVSVVFVKWGA